jgi:hypothetical protein
MNMNLKTSSWRMAQLLWLPFLLLGFVISACEHKSTVDPKLVEQARSAMVAWLECEDCSDQQLLDDLLKHSSRLRPLLISTLEQGLSPATRALYTYQMEQRYQHLASYSQSHSQFKPSMEKYDFVQSQLARFDAHYRSRAAQALAKIGGDASRLALQEALDKSGREDIREAIRVSLEAMGS